MRIGLVDVDGHNFPNLALARLSAWHKANGDEVEMAVPLMRYDRIYKSKVFTFTPDEYTAWMCDDIRKGGTGYGDYTTTLPAEVESMPPDLTLYPQYDFAYGFLSRGCIRKCPWCVVPRKEGAIREVDDIEHLAQGRKKVVIIDNNFLANRRGFVLDQLDKARRLKIRIDFNQALDARLVDDEIADALAKTRWMNYIRFACDTDAAFDSVDHAVRMVKDHGYTREFIIYVLAKDLTALSRVEKLAAIDRVNPFVMPYRNLDGDGSIANDDIKHLARWCNRVRIRKSCTFAEYMET
jgi:hypothetical protein